ncbi:MAG: hypothetical protein ABI893_13465 [Polaromonas sp.]|uniref:hypothetical protein n=1 Tax=Polaromonas sp. TaxID=1869339 RepID=UPI003265D8B4
MTQLLAGLAVLPERSDSCKASRRRRLEGVMSEHCAHRASGWFGSKQDSGLHCLYHGW